MALTKVTEPFAVFTDTDGSPLDGGFIYVGTVDQNPETSPITVYYDEALSVPAAQPLRTSNGYVMRSGSPAVLYVDVDYSITVRDKNGALVIATQSNSGTTAGTRLLAANNLSDVDDAAASLVNLGLTATAAELNQIDGKLVIGTDTNILTTPTITGQALKYLRVNAGETAAEFASPVEPAMVFIESQTASASATLDFTGFNSTLYSGYLWRLDNIIPSSASVVNLLFLRTSTDGGSTYDTGASDYAYAFSYIDMASSPSTVTSGDDANSIINLTGAPAGGASNGGINGELKCFAPHVARPTGFTWDFSYRARLVSTDGPYISLRGGGFRLASSDVDAVRFFINNSNIASGTITMYGLRNS